MYTFYVINSLKKLLYIRLGRQQKGPQVSTELFQKWVFFPVPCANTVALFRTTPVDIRLGRAYDNRFQLAEELQRLSYLQDSYVFPVN